MKMKNKTAEQIANKNAHRERLKSKRRTEPVFERNAPELLEKPTILIVCEGCNTEPSYFNQFRLASAIIKPVGEGYNTISLVKRAIKLAEEKKYEQVWCVFDADPKPGNSLHNQNFNNAIELATSKGFGVAYSNQAFEYWLILHFDDHQGGRMARSTYTAKINSLLSPFKIKYNGKTDKIVTEDLFELLNSIDEKTGKRRVELAIKRAERNYKRWDHKNPSKEESSTTVFRLVKELLKFL